MHGVSQVSMALLPITPEANHQERLPRPQASRCGRAMRTKHPRVAWIRHIIRNGAQHHRCSVTLDLVVFEATIGAGDEGYWRSEHCLPGIYSNIAPPLVGLRSDHRAAAGRKEDEDDAQKPTNHLCKNPVASVTSAIFKHRHKVGGGRLLWRAITINVPLYERHRSGELGPATAYPPRWEK